MAKNIKRKFVKMAMVLLIVFCGAFVFTECQTTTVQAASATTMKKAYQKFVKKHRKNIKGYAYANIGPKGKPALLIGVEKAWGSKNGYSSCWVYYYTNGKVRAVYPYLGGRAISIGRKDGNNYLINGTSSDKVVANIRGNRLCMTHYLNTKERNYTTQKRIEKTPNYLSTSYWMSYSNYSKAVKKFKNVKTIKFKKP